nr:hypothetical protein Iba_chr06bCG12090 [Ipomoea batatas]
MDLRLLPGGPSRPVREAAPVSSFPGLHRSPRCSSLDGVKDGKHGAAALLVSGEFSAAAAEQGGGDGLQLQQRSFPPVFLLSVDGDNTSSQRCSSGDGRRLMVTNSSVQRSIGGSSLPCLRRPRNDQFNDEPERQERASLMARASAKRASLTDLKVVHIPIPASASDQSHTQSDISVAGQSDSHVADTPGSSQTPSNSASPQELPAVASPQDSVHPQSVISTESSSQSVAPQEPPAVASPQDSVHPQPVISTESSS